MARAPALAELSQQPLTDDMGAEPMDAAEPTVICTVLKNADGSYQVIAGDEPEPGGEMEEGEPAMDEEAPAGQTFDSIGAALKGVMDILQADNEGPTGNDTAFREGYAGPKPPASGAT